MHDYTYLICPDTTTSKPLSIVPSRSKALAASQEKESKPSRVKALFLLTAPPLRRTTACTLFCWIAASLVYYGVSLNAANLRWVLRSNLVFGKYFVIKGIRTISHDCTFGASCFSEIPQSLAWVRKVPFFQGRPRGGTAEVSMKERL